MENKKYDVFLSHAFKDKEAIANELNLKLREAGLVVWYSGTDLKGGDHLEEIILNQVIPNSRYSVTVITLNYINSAWTMAEFNAIAAIETSTSKRIIPVLFNLTFEEAAYFFPAHKHCFALKGSPDLDKCVRQIIRTCKTTDYESEASQNASVHISDSGMVSLRGNITVQGKNISGKDMVIHQNSKNKNDGKH